MEPLNPASIIQTINEKHESKNYLLQLNNLKYNIKIEKSESFIIIICDQLDNISPFNYKISLSLEDFKKINDMFKIYDNIIDLFKSINDLFENKKVAISEINENVLILKIKLIDIIGNEKSFNINLIKNEINKDLIINKLCQIINDKNKIIENHEIRLQKLENQISILLKQNKEIKKNKCYCCG